MMLLMMMIMFTVNERMRERVSEREKKRFERRTIHKNLSATLRGPVTTACEKKTTTERSKATKIERPNRKKERSSPICVCVEHIYFIWNNVIASRWIGFWCLWCSNVAKSSVAYGVLNKLPTHNKRVRPIFNPIQSSCFGSKSKFTWNETRERKKNEK